MNRRAFMQGAAVALSPAAQAAGRQAETSRSPPARASTRPAGGASGRKSMGRKTTMPSGIW